MSTYKFYSKYKKNKKDLVVDSSISSCIDALLKEIVPEDSTHSFLKSLQNFHKEFEGLTHNQFQSLKDVEAVLSEKKSTEHEEWRNQYDEEKRKRAIICAQYYKANPPYYASLIDKILKDEDFVPTRKQYFLMCDNKYTKKVLRETFSEPLFEAGTLVQGRKSAPLNIKDKYLAVIASNEGPVTSAARGAKVYLVLPLGENKPVSCQERYLKKVKKT